MAEITIEQAVKVLEHFGEEIVLPGEWAITEALNRLSKSEEVMGRVENYLIAKGERWIYDEVHPHLDSYLRFDDQGWPLSPLQELRPCGLIERALSLNMTPEQMMGVEG